MNLNYPIKFLKVFLKQTSLSAIILGNCVIYTVNVEFNKDFLTIKENQITVGIKSRPIKGEANKEIIKKLARHFKISTSLIQIKTGQRSKQKIIEIQN